MTITPNSSGSKGICIDDTTAAATPGAISWPCTSQNASFFRTYHYQDDVAASSWVTYCVNNNIPVMVGLTAGSASEITAFSNDYQKSPANYNKNVMAIAVGNEPKTASDISNVLTGIASVKALQASGKLPNVPVTTVLSMEGPWFAGATYPPAQTTFSSTFIHQILPQIGVVAFNCYGGYFIEGAGGITLSNSLSWTPGNSVLLNQFAAIRAAMTAAGVGMPFWCTETGWSSTGGSASWSNVANLQTFYENFLNYSTGTADSPDKIFYFSKNDADNESFGLSTNNTPKFTSC